MYRSLLVLILLPLSALGDWPGNARIAVNLTFDLDAETIRWSDTETMSGNPAALSQGRYGPEVAVPRILEMLARHEMHATFFIPAWVIGNHPAAAQAIAAAGHEIGAHGVRHISPIDLTPDEERDAFSESIRVIEQLSGKRPAGYRAPSWAYSAVSLQLAKKFGFTYSSNRMDADVPYVHDDPEGLVELPVSWVLDDAPYFWFDESTWDKKIHSAADVRAIWQEEFTAAWETGGYVNLTLHPQIIGRPARLRMLDELLTWMKSHDGVWFATCAEVASRVGGQTAKSR